MSDDQETGIDQTEEDRHLTELVVTNCTCFLFFCVSSYSLYYVSREYLNSHHTKSSHLSLIVCILATIIPPIHITAVWSFILDWDWLTVISTVITSLLSLAASICLFISELHKLTDVFDNTPQQISTSNLRKLQCSMVISIILFIVWVLFNERMHRASHTIKGIMTAICLIAGILSLGSYLSITILFSNRLFQLVVQSQRMTQFEEQTITEQLSICSQSRSIPVTNSPPVSPDPSTTINNYRDRPQLTPVPVSNQSKNHINHPSMKMSQSLDHFQVNQRPFIEAIARQFVLSMLASIVVIFVVFAVVLWSVSSGLHPLAIAAYCIEQLAWTLATLRIYLNEKSHIKQYEYVCGCVHHWSLFGAAWVIDSRVRNSSFNLNSNNNVDNGTEIVEMKKEEEASVNMNE